MAQFAYWSFFVARRCAVASVGTYSQMEVSAGCVRGVFYRLEHFVVAIDDSAPRSCAFLSVRVRSDMNCTMSCRDRDTRA